MRIIDFHTHIYPPKVALKATQSICDFYELDNCGMDGTLDMLFERGNKAGISGYVLLPVAVKPDHVRSINDFIINSAKTSDNLYGFGTVHAGMDNICDEAEYIINSGLHGVKMHPDTQLFNIDDERLFGMYETIQGRIPVIFHAGDPRYDYSHPKRIKRVIELFPKLDVIAAHFGGYSVYEEAYNLLKDKNCYMDISSSLMFMKPGVAEKYINAYGADRLLYGTDYPLWDPVVEVERFMKLDISDADKEKIAWQNALKILKKG